MGKRQTGECGQQYTANNDIPTCSFRFATGSDRVSCVALAHNLMMSSTRWLMDGQQTDSGNGQWTDNNNGQWTDQNAQNGSSQNGAPVQGDIICNLLSSSHTVPPQEFILNSPLCIKGSLIRQKIQF